MAATLSFLLFGLDPGLLETRRWVLEAAGYKVQTISALDDLDPALVAEAAGVLILCHSVPVEECNRAIGVARSKYPSMGVIAMHGVRTSYPVDAHVETLDATDGPADLLASVAKLALRIRPVSKV